MKQNKYRKLFTYALLAFLIIIFLMTIYAFIFKGFEAGMSMFAYNVFLSIIVYFFLMWQRRMEEKAASLSGDSDVEGEIKDDHVIDEDVKDSQLRDDEKL